MHPEHWDDEPFDAIVSNPPYSIKWAGKENPILINDERFSPAGVLAPSSKADLAFTMHMLSWLSPKGTAAIVEFPGVLYRGGAEQKIRQYMIDNNCVLKDIHMVILEEISMYLQQGRARNVKKLVEQALAEGLSPQSILEEGLMSGMNIIGQKFKDNEVFVPEVLVSARAMNMGMDALKPYLMQENTKPAGKVVIGTVKGDLHDIGKNLVKLMLESKGFEVIDAGVDVSAEQFVEKAIENDANIISCSALLTTTMLEMRRVVEVATEKGIRDRVKIMIGGAPVTQKYCAEIGADGYTSDAVSAAEMALELVK